MDLINIIREELKTTLNETYVLKDDKFKFKTLVQNTTFQNYDGFTNEFDVNVSESNIILTWRISFWLNEQGIESFIINADGVEGQYKLDYYNKHSDALEQQNQKEISENNWKFIVDQGAMLQQNISLYPTSLDFDYKTNTCTVKF